MSALLDAVIVGFGNRAKSLVARLGERTGIQAVAVVEPVAERRRAAQAEFGIGAGFDSLEALRAAGVRADCAFVLTPPHLHAAPFVACAEAGLHLFCEKPIDMELPAAERMLFAARRAGIKTLFGFNRRYMPASRLAWAALRGERPHFVHVSKSRPMTYSRMLAENAVHAADLLLHLAGSTPERVVGVGRFKAVEIEAEGYIGAAVEFVNGAAGSLQMITDGAGVVERFEVYGPGFTLTAELPDRIRYMGDASRLEAAAQATGIELQALGEGSYRLVTEDASGVTAELRHFAALIGGHGGRAGAAGEAHAATTGQAAVGDAGVAAIGRRDQPDAREAPTVEAVFEAQRLVEDIYAACGLPKTRRLKTWVRES